ncbi:MAG: transcription termination/antitermination protein NusG [Kiritimatiellae bacterium]|nr:transcription termination/antitermination protein NusG [Kiritimatiellia bacterium]
MAKEWFVIHTLTGQESKVKDSIERRTQQEEMGDYIGDVLVPTEKVSEVKQGKKTTATRKFFPGYVLAQIDLYDAKHQINDKSWYFIRETPGIIGFVGGEKPVPLRQEEVDVLLCQVDERAEKVKPKVSFEPGETVKITDGPFMNFSGVIEEVDPERGRLKISVAIFGRSAPVEVEYWQVERV